MARRGPAGRTGGSGSAGRASTPHRPAGAPPRGPAPGRRRPPTRACAGKAALFHPDDDDVVELEALGGMGGGKAEDRVVAAERGRAVCGPRGQLRSCPVVLRVAGCPAKEIPVAPRRGPRGRRLVHPSAAGRSSRAAVRVRRLRAASCSSASLTSCDSMGSSIRGARNGQPEPRATATAGSSSRLVRARTARVDPSSGHALEHAPEADRLLAAVRCEDQAALRTRPGPHPLRELLAVVGDEPDGALDDRRRTAMVHLEVDASQARAATAARPSTRRHRRAASRRSLWSSSPTRKMRFGAPQAAGRAGAAPGRRPDLRRPAVPGSARANE